MGTERGVFGGTAGGIWLIRQKHETNKRKKQEKKTLPLPLPRIQWDEEKCRPIYEHHHHCLSSSLQTQSSESDEENNIEAEEEESESISANSSPSPRIFLNTNNKRQRSNRGVFGLGNKTRRFAVAMMTRHNNEDIPNDHRVLPVVIDRKQEHNHQVHEKTSKIEGKKNKAKCLERKDKPTETVNPSKAIRQPGPQTALLVAREFFSKLDQTSLNIVTDNNNSNDNNTDPELDNDCSKIPIHTRRGKLPRDLVRTEYRKYKDACRCANIRPLSQREFLHQRAEFFRPGEIFDGMFDD
jgi:hypothetical protein